MSTDTANNTEGMKSLKVWFKKADKVFINTGGFKMLLPEFHSEQKADRLTFMLWTLIMIAYVMVSAYFYFNGVRDLFNSMA